MNLHNKTSFPDNKGVLGCGVLSQIGSLHKWSSKRHFIIFWYYGSRGLVTNNYLTEIVLTEYNEWFNFRTNKCSKIVCSIL